MNTDKIKVCCVWTRFWMKQSGRQATGWWTLDRHRLGVRTVAVFRFCVRKSDQLQRVVDRRVSRPFQSLVALDPRTANEVHTQLLLFRLEYPSYSYSYSYISTPLLLFLLLLVSEDEKVKSPLCLVERNAVNIYEGVGGMTPNILTLGIRWT
jgi:hypothetical protein